MATLAGLQRDSYFRYVFPFVFYLGAAYPRHLCTDDRAIPPNAEGSALSCGIDRCGDCFLPWIWVVATRLDKLAETTQWASSYQTNLLGRVNYWLYNLGIGFVDFEWPVSFTNPLSYLILAVVAYSTYQLCRHTPKRAWLFVVLLMSVSTLAQIVPDVLGEGRRSLLPRYSLTAYLGIEMAVAYVIAQAFSTDSLKSDHRKTQQVCVVALLFGGVLSSLLITQSLGWGKGSSNLILEAAPFINSTGQPVVLTDADHTFILSLSHQVSPDTRFILLNKENNPDYVATLKQLSPNSVFFTYNPSESLLAFLESTENIVMTESTKAERKAHLYQFKLLPER